MIKKILKIYWVFFLLGGGTGLRAMEDVLSIEERGFFDQQPIIIEEQNIISRKNNRHESPSIISQDTSKQLYQIAAINQKGATCAYHAFYNAARIVDSLEHLENAIESGTTEIPPYQSALTLDLEKDLLDTSSIGRSCVVKRRIIPIAKKKLLDELNSNIKEYALEIGGEEDKEGCEKVLDLVLQCALKNIEHTVIYSPIEQPQGFLANLISLIFNCGFSYEPIVWSIERQELFDTFDTTIVNYLEDFEFRKPDYTDVYRKAALKMHPMLQQDRDILNKLFKEDLITTLTFDSSTDIYRNIDRGNWAGSDDLEGLIELFSQMGKIPNDCIHVIAAQGFRNNLSHAIKVAWGFGPEAKIAGLGAPLKNVISEYEGLYEKLTQLSVRILNSDQDIAEAFLVRLGTSSQEFSSHWVPLVVSRLNGGPVRYYVADSSGNSTRMKDPQINGIIALLNGEEASKRSIYTVDDRYRQAAEQWVDERPFSVLDFEEEKGLFLEKRLTQGLLGDTDNKETPKVLFSQVGDSNISVLKKNEGLGEESLKKDSISDSVVRDNKEELSAPS
ncbi:hypothetical protein H0X06_00240, partial [Candidatus Dependentiae bacterium]|nr:hypothetical protein [Candidatus Dependentiae bacterium]